MSYETRSQPVLALPLGSCGMLFKSSTAIWINTMPSLLSKLLGQAESGARRALARPLPAEPSRDPKAATDRKVKQALEYETALIKEAVAYIETAKGGIKKAESLKPTVRGGEKTKLDLIVLHGLRLQFIERLLKSRNMRLPSDVAQLIAYGKKCEQDRARLKSS
jgi:hypothetical protein